MIMDEQRKTEVLEAKLYSAHKENELLEKLLTLLESANQQNLAERDKAYEIIGRLMTEAELL